jgi:hypothetical protein
MLPSSEDSAFAGATKEAEPSKSPIAVVFTKWSLSEINIFKILSMLFNMQGGLACKCIFTNCAKKL